MKKIKISEIRGALARGYCSKENEKKILDPDLIESMTLEIGRVLISYGVKICSDYEREI